MNSIIFQINEGVATITLSRPEKLNSFNREMALGLQDRLDECEKNISVRCVVITGDGKAFCAGQDLAEVTDPLGSGMENILSEQLNPIIIKIRTLSKPVLAVVNGVAAGAGANIALCCDVVIASENASFIQAFSKIGLIPDSGGTYFLPRLIGFQKASALMMLGDKVPAKDAKEMGMLYEVFPDATLFLEAEKLSMRLAALPTKALAFTKQALNASFFQTLDQQLQTEDTLQEKAAGTNDFAEGVQAFLEKRKPDFKGD